MSMHVQADRVIAILTDAKCRFAARPWGSFPPDIAWSMIEAANAHQWNEKMRDIVAPFAEAIGGSDDFYEWGLLASVGDVLAAFDRAIDIARQLQAPPSSDGEAHSG